MIIAEKSYDEKLLKPFEKRKKVSIELGLAPTLIPIMFSLFDSNELFFGTLQESNISLNPHLWTSKV